MCGGGGVGRDKAQTILLCIVESTVSIFEIRFLTKRQLCNVFLFNVLNNGISTDILRAL